MREIKIIVAIDIGSSSVRCSAYELLDADDPSSTASQSPTIKALDNCRSSRPVRSVRPNTGKIQLHSSDDTSSIALSLMDHLDECMDELLSGIRSTHGPCGFQILAVGFSSFVMNLVAVDANGTIIGEDASISYACNSPEVAEQCRSLKRQLCEDDMQQLYQTTGAPIHSAYALPQLLALYDRNHHNYNTALSLDHKWQTIASICVSRWTGATVLPISFSEASWTGLLNFRTCEYESSAVVLLPEPCRRALPLLADFSDRKHPGLRYGISKHKSKNVAASNPYFDRWPELRGSSDDSSSGCRLFLGLGDGACANIGSKCSTANRIAVTVGTSAAARVCLPFPVLEEESTTTIRVPRGLFCYRVNRAHILVGGALTDGGCVVEWASSLLNLSSKEALNECMAKVEGLVQENYSHTKLESPDGKSQRQNLIMVPFLSGERSTGYRDGATGAMIGLTRETTPAHLLKGCLEGVTLRLQAVLHLIQKTMRNISINYDSEQNQATGSYPCTIIASGKALEVNSLWRQLLSDCSGLKVIMDSETEEGTSRGVALAVAVALHATRSSSGSVHFADEPIVVSTQSTPNSLGKNYWKQAADSQDVFIDTISPLYH